MIGIIGCVPIGLSEMMELSGMHDGRSIGH